MPLKSYTLADIRQLKPCYDPATKVPEDWTGTVADILRIESISAMDRIWVAARLLDDHTARLFAVWCARETLKFVKEPDPRSVMACDVAERFANGAATAEELAAAWDAASDAAAAAHASARKAQVTKLLSMIEAL